MAGRARRGVVVIVGKGETASGGEILVLILEDAELDALRERRTVTYDGHEAEGVRPIVVCSYPTQEHGLAALGEHYTLGRMRPR